MAFLKQPFLHPLSVYVAQIPATKTEHGQRFRLISAKINTNPTAEPTTIATLDVQYKGDRGIMKTFWLPINGRHEVEQPFPH